MTALVTLIPLRERSFTVLEQGRPFHRVEINHAAMLELLKENFEYAEHHPEFKKIIGDKPLLTKLLDELDYKLRYEMQKENCTWKCSQDKTVFDFFNGMDGVRNFLMVLEDISQSIHIPKDGVNVSNNSLPSAEHLYQSAYYQLAATITQQLHDEFIHPSHSANKFLR